MQRFFRVYGRALSFLRPHRAAAAVLCLANLALAAIGFLEPVLFGHVIQGLGGAGPSPANIAAWAGLGVLGIVSGMATSLVADRLTHKLRLRVAGRAYAHVLQLPASYHARFPSGSLVKTLWSGTDELFGLWLGLFREHLSTALILAGLLPVAVAMNPALGAVLAGLAVAFAATVALTTARTQAGQRRAEDAHTVLSAQVGDVLGNAPLIRAFDVAPQEAASFGRLAGDVLRHQFPVLGWWAGVTVMSRAASTVATVAVVCLGAWLHGRGEATMAEVVTFMGFAGMLIGRLESAMWCVARMGGSLTKLEDFFAMLDAGSMVHDPAGRPAMPRGPGAVGVPRRALRLPRRHARAGWGRLRRPPRGDRGAGRRNRLGQEHRDGAAATPVGHGGRPGADRRNRRAGREPRLAARSHRHRAAGNPAAEPHDPRQPPPRPARSDARRGRAWRRGWPRRTSSSCASPAATTRSSASAAPRFPAASGSAWRSPAPCCATRASSCWTRRPAPSTDTPRKRSCERCGRPPSDAPPSSSRTGWRLSGTRTASCSSSAAWWPSRARSTSWWRATAPSPPWARTQFLLPAMAEEPKPGVPHLQLVYSRPAEPAAAAADCLESAAGGR